MSRKLYWNTVTPLLKSILLQLLACDLFDSFRLVGGTSLSLQLGHRMSVDIDLFTDAAYGSIDFGAINRYLRMSFPYFSASDGGNVGLGTAYFIGNSEADCIKLDLYYTDQFIQPALEIGGIRMATIEEIIAMKVDIVQRGGRKKDFWDLHELIDIYPPEKMVQFHEQRYPYGHDKQLILAQFLNFSIADDDFEPICLRGKFWEVVKWDITKSLGMLR